MKTLKYLLTTILLTVISFCSQFANAQDFNVTYVPGHQYSYKPSISQRLQGTDEVVVIVPRNQSKVDQYYYACIVNYFKRLGVPVRTYQAHFEKKNQQMGSIQVVWGSLAEDISDCWSDANTLIDVANCVSSFGYYTGEKEVGQITIIDPVNDFNWEFKFDMPNKEEKFDKKLKSLIASSYYKNNSARQIYPHYKSNWTGEWKFKDYLVSAAKY